MAGCLMLAAELRITSQLRPFAGNVVLLDHQPMLRQAQAKGLSALQK
ncbi:MAG: hypothetical protein U0074_10750 [Kouleothrix sp.]